MITIQEALQIIHSQPVKQQRQILQLDRSTGYFLAEKIASPLHLPSFDNSAMDGYAICGTRDTYAIIGEIAAGEMSPFTLNEGEAFRIFTGAKVPQNTTAVIMQEKTEVVNNQVKINDEIKEGKNIRKKGEEITSGQIVFEPGQALNPAAIGLLASLGIVEVLVYSKPVVSILTTGSELVTPGNALTSGQIYESNGYTLESALSAFGFDCGEKRHEQDDYESIRRSVNDLLSLPTSYHGAPGVLLISGGISVGEYDFVKQALSENGVEELFYKIKQKPGKPLFFGRKKEMFVFALPGNPASALTCFYIYVLPFLQKLSGSTKPGLLKLQVPLAHSYEMKSDRPTFFKAHVEKKVTILDRQSSSMLYSMAAGNALVLLDGVKHYEKGESVECMVLY